MYQLDTKKIYSSLAAAVEAVDKWITDHPYPRRAYRVRVSRDVAKQITGSEKPEEELSFGRSCQGIDNTDYIFNMIKESNPPIFYLGEC